MNIIGTGIHAVAAGAGLEVGRDLYKGAKRNVRGRKGKGRSRTPKVNWDQEMEQLLAEEQIRTSERRNAIERRTWR